MSAEEIILKEAVLLNILVLPPQADRPRLSRPLNVLGSLIPEAIWIQTLLSRPLSVLWSLIPETIWIQTLQAGPEVMGWL